MSRRLFILVGLLAGSLALAGCTSQNITGPQVPQGGSKDAEAAFVEEMETPETIKEGLGGQRLQEVERMAAVERLAAQRRAALERAAVSARRAAAQ